MKISSSTLSVNIALLLSSFLINASAYSESQCLEPRAPIIPDGNIASKDEIIGASKALKAFQEELRKYRSCLSNKSSLIKAEDVDSTTEKFVLLQRYNDSVDSETLAANKFNQALRTFNKK